MMIQSWKKAWIVAGPLILVACSQEQEPKISNAVTLAEAAEVTNATAADVLPQATLSGATIDVVKTPTCGCCSAWIDHVREAGFLVRVTDVEDVTHTARQLGIPDELRSCHTASVAGYAIEGHVPAADIQRLIQERPKAAGIAVPGMPIGSPGMEQDGRVEAYATMLFDIDGSSRVFAQH
jgi:hypothetical protein